MYKYVISGRDLLVLKRTLAHANFLFCEYVADLRNVGRKVITYVSAANKFVWCLKVLNIKVGAQWKHEQCSY